MKKFLALIVVALFGVTIANAGIGGVATDVDVNYHSVIEVNGNPNVLVPVKLTDGTEFFVKVEKAKYDKAVNAIAESLTESIEKLVVQINQYKALADQYKILAQDEEVESEPGGIYNPRPEEAWQFRSFSPMLASLINQYTSQGYELSEAVELVMGDLGEVLPRSLTGISAFISHALSEIIQIVVNERLRIGLEPIADITHFFDDLQLMPRGMPFGATVFEGVVDAILGTIHLSTIATVSDTLYHPGEGEGFGLIDLVGLVPMVGAVLAALMTAAESYPEFLSNAQGTYYGDLERNFISGVGSAVGSIDSFGIADMVVDFLIRDTYE